jgi:hypothetical protein
VAIVGSIHDDETATALGFRGGTVAGSVHLDQFPPLLLQAFGQPWFETGSLSLYFRHATTDGESVKRSSSVRRQQPASGRGNGCSRESSGCVGIA